MVSSDIMQLLETEVLLFHTRFTLSVHRTSKERC